MNNKWMWQSNPHPWSKSQPAEWSHYSDVENLIIEEAFTAKKPQAFLDDYHIDFEHNVQISNNDVNRERPVKRVVCKRDDEHLREERFMPDPIAPKRPFGGQYGWVSPFILEVKKYFKLGKKQLPSRDTTIIPMIVEKAALGIIDEGRKVGKQREAEKMAKELMEQKEKGMQAVWKCCAHLYSMESFLYKKLNETMRLIGSEEHEQIWRNKVSTLGPFSLLLWDDPNNREPTIEKQLIYRGAKLSDAQIATYMDCSQSPDEYRSFQAFTSCSRNRSKAEKFGNTLFIMEVKYAFTVDLSPLSEYPGEEEELIIPGVCFTVQRVDFDKTTNAHWLIYLQLQQRWNAAEKHEVSTNSEQATTYRNDNLNDLRDLALKLRRDSAFGGALGALGALLLNGALRRRDRNGDLFN